MGDHDMTPRRAPEAVLVALAEALADWASPGFFPVYETNDPLAEGHNRVARALDAYRTAVAPLRTRASVDAEIATTIRAAYRAGVGSVSYSADQSLKLYCLCSEPTADETERAQPAECEWCQDSTQPQLHQYRIPESIVRVCTRCLEERGLAAKVKP